MGLASCSNLFKNLVYPESEAMCCKLVVFLVLLGVTSYAAENDIPALCKTASVTAVSCSGFDAAGDGLLPHPDDCRLFYYCVGAAAAPVCRQCPAGLHFSPDTHVCDQPDHAGCQSTANK